jgi:hypothetical protein
VFQVSNQNGLEKGFESPTQALLLGEYPAEFVVYICQKDTLYM